MDLVKIGAYIASKRKALGLTQKQVAEQLGMSDKSVSKWERGICLPDVSVYLELCEILGITINEFLAGEDIPREDLPAKSEDNLIQVAQDSQHRQRRLKRVIATLVALTLLVGGCLGVVLYGHFSQPQNYIQALDQNSPEVTTAELLSQNDGAMLFRFHAKKPYHQLTVYQYEYRSGELVAKTAVADFFYADQTAWSDGMLAFILDFDASRVRLVVANDGTTHTKELPILEGVEDNTSYIRGSTQVEGTLPISDDAEQGLLALGYGKWRLAPLSMEQLAQGNAEPSMDYAYYFSVEFSLSSIPPSTDC